MFIFLELELNDYPLIVKHPMNLLKVQDKFIRKRKDFIEPFLKIEWLERKPKLFFIQACNVPDDVPQSRATQSL